MECLNFTTNVLVALIGAGVTGLIGVNIWTSLSIDKRIESIVDDRLSYLKSENEQLRNDLMHFTNASYLITEANIYSNQKQFDISFLKYLKGIECLSKINKVDKSAEYNQMISSNMDICFEGCLMLIRTNESDIINSKTVQNLSKSVQDILLRESDKRSYELYSFLYDLFS